MNREAKLGWIDGYIKVMPFIEPMLEPRIQ